MKGNEVIYFVLFKKVPDSNQKSEFYLLLDNLFIQNGIMPLSSFIYVDSNRNNPTEIIKAIKTLPSSSKFIDKIIYTVRMRIVSL